MAASDARKVSELLDDLAKRPHPRVSLADLVATLGDRAFGVLMLLLALPNAVGIGTIPGVSTVFGVPQILVAGQMMAGLRRPWLPRFLLTKSIAAADFRRVVERAHPRLARVERMLRPRLSWLVSPLAERLLGAVFLVLAFIVSMPIPLGNQPPAVAMALIAIGIIERDGRCVLIGLLVSVVATLIALAVVSLGAAAVWYAVTHVFG